MNKEELIEELKKEIEATKNVLNCEEHFSLYAKGKRVGLEFGWMFAEKLDEPELPAIPRFVAEWIEEEKRNSASYVGMMLRFHNMDLNAEINGYINRNYETFARALLLDGYKIEKEPQWVVKDDTGYLSYLQFSIPNIYERESSLDKNDAYKFNSKSKADLVADLVDGEVVEVPNV